MISLRAVVLLVLLLLVVQGMCMRVVVHRVGTRRGLRRLGAGDIVVAVWVLQGGVCVPVLSCTVGVVEWLEGEVVHGGKRAGRRARREGKGEGGGLLEDVVVGDGGGRERVLGRMEEHGRKERRSRRRREEKKDGEEETINILSSFAFRVRVR